MKSFSILLHDTIASWYEFSFLIITDISIKVHFKPDEAIAFGAKFYVNKICTYYINVCDFWYIYRILANEVSN